MVVVFGIWLVVGAIRYGKAMQDAATGKRLMIGAILTAVGGIALTLCGRRTPHALIWVILPILGVGLILLILSGVACARQGKAQQQARTEAEKQKLGESEAKDPGSQ